MTKPQDYKATLSLPHTDFPMRARLAEREPLWWQAWQVEGRYEAIQASTSGRSRYIVHDGPPYANGQLHVGHACNKILKDLVMRSRTLSGYQTPFVPGWDCHGLPIAHKVETAQQATGKVLEGAAFRDACRTYAQGQLDQQREDFQRLGVLGDWANPYVTMAPSFEADVMRCLATLVEKGHVVPGTKPVHWCLDCGSALAEAEVVYQDKASWAIDVAFEVVEPSAFLDLAEEVVEGVERVVLPIWTTTPWTLPANRAVALHPEASYTLWWVEEGNTALLLGEPLADEALARYGLTARCVAKAEGARWLEAGAAGCHHPFLDRVVPLLGGEHVTMDAGTGSVHTAPAHGAEDYALCQSLGGFSLESPLEGDGRFVEGTPVVGGLDVEAANLAVCDALDASGHLLAKARLEHSYPHCWRHRTPLVFRATPQWFVSMDAQGLRAQALEAVRSVTWLPAWGEERMAQMVAERPDWCISRQRRWGTPMPFLVHRQTGALHPNTPAIARRVADRVERDGMEAWFASDVSTWLPAEEVPDYRQLQDTLDVWFDAGVTHTAVLRRRDDLGAPADMYLEGTDQHRGWFQASLLTSVAMYGVAPYRQVLTYGFTVDGEGRKMSKSLGNVVHPSSVIETYGADVLRWWVASTDYRGEMALSDGIVKQVSELYRRVRNTVRFFLANCHGFNPVTDAVAPEDSVWLDRWVVDQALQVQDTVIAAYERCDFHVVVQAIHHFASVTCGGYYLDVVKDRQYTLKVDGLPRRSAQTAMWHMAQAMVRWLAPVCAFTSEEIWSCLRSLVPEADAEAAGVAAPSVLMLTWYDGLQCLPDNAPLTRQDGDTLLCVRNAVNKVLEDARQSNQLGGSLTAEVALAAEPDLHAVLERLGSELRFLLLTSRADLVRADGMTGDGWVATECNGLSVRVVRSEAPKCARCWHRCQSVGDNTAWPALCHRCVVNVNGRGEIRRWA